MLPTHKPFPSNTDWAPTMPLSAAYDTWWYCRSGLGYRYVNGLDELREAGQQGESYG